MISGVKPSAITIPSSFGRVRAALIVPLCAVLAVIAPVAANTRWARQDPGFAVYLALVASVTALLIYRGWRTGLRFDSDGLTIRYFFVTRRLGWHEVSHFADGLTNGVGEGAGEVWALHVVLRDGRVVKVKATARDHRVAAPKVLTAVQQAAEQYGIPANLTGTA